MTAAEDDQVLWEMVLRPVAEDVRTARAFAVRHVSRFATDDEAGDDFLTAAATITSEFGTNALNAGAGLIRLGVEIAADCVVISVVDDAAGALAMAAHDPLALSGRGLRIIDRLARRWGVSPHPDGKRVWAELDFPK